MNHWAKAKRNNNDNNINKTLIIRIAYLRTSC